jgi:hypothetical protein
MKTKKEKILLISLMFTSMVLVGLVLNSYDLLLNDKAVIDVHEFNNIFAKSLVVSFVILIVLVISNYKKFINDKSDVN